MGDKAATKTSEPRMATGPMSQEDIHDTLEDAGIDLSVEDAREDQRDADLKAAHSTPAPDKEPAPTTNESKTYTRQSGSPEKDAEKKG